MNRLTQKYRLLCTRLGAVRSAAVSAIASTLVIRNYRQLQPRVLSRRSGRFPYRIISWAAVAAIGIALLGAGRIGLARESNAAFDAMIARHAKANDVPESLIRRVIWRESKYNPGLVGRGNAMGLMQIKPATAREVGFQGPSSSLLDAETNMKYATRYLAGAYRVAGGNADRAVALYAKGYYFEAKRRGMLAVMERHRRASEQSDLADSSADENPARHAASFQLASAEPVANEAPARIVPGARTVTTETIRKEAVAPEQNKARPISTAAREAVRIAALAPAVPLPREKPLTLAATNRNIASMREVSAVRSIPAREPVNARQLAAAREAAAIAPDSFATGDLFVPYATPVLADATPRYTTASVRTLSDLPTTPHVLDENKIAAVESPRALEPPRSAQPERIALAKPATEPQPIAQTQTAPQAEPRVEAMPNKPAQQERAASTRRTEEAAAARQERRQARRERAASRAAARARTQQSAPAPTSWLEQQFASFGRALSGNQQSQQRRAAAQ